MKKPENGAAFGLERLMRQAHHEGVARDVEDEYGFLTWLDEEGAIDGLTESLRSQRHLAYASLRGDGQEFEYGDPGRGRLVHTYDLSHEIGGNLGVLVVHFDRGSALHAVQDRVVPVILFTMIPIGAMALATLVLFRRMVTQPL